MFNPGRIIGGTALCKWHTKLIKFEYLQENDKNLVSMRDPMLAYAQDKTVKIKIILLATKITAIAVVR